VHVGSRRNEVSSRIRVKPAIARKSTVVTASEIGMCSLLKPTVDEAVSSAMRDQANHLWKPVCDILICLEKIVQNALSQLQVYVSLRTLLDTTIRDKSNIQ